MWYRFAKCIIRWRELHPNSFLLSNYKTSWKSDCIFVGWFTVVLKFANLLCRVVLGAIRLLYFDFGPIYSFSVLLVSNISVHTIRRVSHSKNMYFQTTIYLAFWADSSKGVSKIALSRILFLNFSPLICYNGVMELCILKLHDPFRLLLFYKIRLCFSEAILERWSTIETARRYLSQFQSNLHWIWTNWKQVYGSDFHESA